MQSFEYNLKTPRVIFGAGTLSQLPEELTRLSSVRPLILSTPEQAQQALDVSAILKQQVAGTYTKARMHTPLDITQEALGVLLNSQGDAIISVGGGSTIGLGKALSIRSGLSHIAIPTTYAGSEVTPILGETIDGRKKTRTDPKILPSLVIYDVDLTLSLPAPLTATSAINSIAHATEAIYAKNSNPIICLLAQEGVRALARVLPTLIEHPKSPEARASALYGAWLCGICLGNTTMALHHKLCHVIGGLLDLPHAQTHAVILPHALSYNAPKGTEASRLLAEALPDSGGEAIQGLNVLLRKAKVGRSLKELGMQEDDIDKVADAAMLAPYWNPRDFNRSVIRELVRRAWAGEEAREGL
ncbi:hypothetical protein NM208_g9105 [Fusarium decemcellulare]|uniref:Uncharacterized protein n=1 Tax=Fusarium decemcellulare TaxID=57161 RepID=A0ACC1S333_9HYPO|nr:hypothetical protein NM208_g9105 [Fusarium decemcellulare]